MAKLISIYWRDIPAQVIGRVGRTNHKRELSPRFAQAIDRAAMRAGKGTSELYLSEWRRESEEVDSSDIEALVAARVAGLEDRFSDVFLEAVVKAGGIAETVKQQPPGATSWPGEES
ncbi:MAG TPA: virulence factor [Xanthomonadales bacterium]|nr:virulence factor [Xanthomonadales bacterium]